MNVERLEKAAAFLCTVPEAEEIVSFGQTYRKFDLGVWEHFSCESDPFDGTFNCGFSGCAIGWIAHAGIIPGLTMQNGDPVYDEGSRGYSLQWDAVRKAFDLESDEATWLFSEVNYPIPYSSITPKMVADRIGLLVKRKNLKLAKKFADNSIQEEILE